MIKQAGPNKLLIFGFGYSGRAIAKLAVSTGYSVTATSREPDALAPEFGVSIIPFEDAAQNIATATHIVAAAAPTERGDPILHRYQNEIAGSETLIWIGYLSTTGVYGNRDGAWVDEDTPRPKLPRAHRRVSAEAAWSTLANPVIATPSWGKQSIFPATEQDGLPRRQAPPRNDGRVALDIFRLAGIYGPGRSMFDDLRNGNARRVIKPGHLFGRIHRDDIAQGVLAAMNQNPPPGTRIFNFSDDEPAASADVVAEAARLLNIPPPAPVNFADAAQKMSPMGLSFWSENRRVANTKTKAALNIKWKHPTYREGLAATLAEERDQSLT